MTTRIENSDHADLLPLQCPSCSYDLRGEDLRSGDLRGGNLRGTPSVPRDRCSECGLALTAAALSAAREQTFFRSLRRTLVILIIMLPIVGVAAMATRAAWSEAWSDHALYVAPLVVLLCAPLVLVLVAAICSRRIPED